jgi:hypothetical protein
MTNARWEEELGIPIRLPRPPIETMGEILQNAREPQIFLKSEYDGDAIVIKFPRRSTEEPVKRLGKSLPIAFKEVLWRKAEKHNNTTWSELEKIGRAAYRDAWLMLFQRMYLNRRDPTVEKWLEEAQRDLKLATKSDQRRGRRPSPKAESMWLGRQFDEILGQSEAVHRAAQSAVRSLHRPTEIRKAIWGKVERSIQDMPWYGAIFSGEAFDSIIYEGRGRPQLHDPKSWKPRQLAIALLAMRRGYDYQTVEKQLARIRPARRN